MGYDIKSIRAEFKAKGVFYTSQELALFLKSFIPSDISEIYDPTCGDGALLSVFSDDTEKYGQEITGHQLEEARRRLHNFTGVRGDTLKDPAFFGRKFRGIVANPPFSIAWEPPQSNGLFADDRFRLAPTLPPRSKADYAFILHIIHYLADDGVAVILGFPGILYRGNSEGVIRKWIVEQNYIEKVISIPGDKFVDTKIQTCALVLRKNKTTTDIEFIDDEKRRSRTAKLEEVAKNDYSLCVSRYIVEEAQKEHLDPNLLQNIARQETLRKLKADIEADEMVCKLEGWSVAPFLDEIIEVAKEHYPSDGNITQEATA